jgi:hypothetical protein
VGSATIHSELMMLGIEVAQSPVARYMIGRHGPPPSQGWKTFLRNHAAGIAAIDLFVVRTVSFKLLYGLVILRNARRRLVRIGVTNNPTAEWIAGQVTDAFPFDEAPRHLIRNRDGAFGPAFTKRIRAMGVEITPLSRGRRGKMGMLSGLSDQSVASHSTTLWCLAKRTCATSSRTTPPITTRSGLISRWIRMPRIFEGRRSSVVS